MRRVRGRIPFCARNPPSRISARARWPSLSERRNRNGIFRYSSVQNYLNLPWWYAAAKQADAELLRQLDLIGADVVRTAERFHDADARRQADHTRYLEDRGREG